MLDHVLSYNPSDSNSYAVTTTPKNNDGSIDIKDNSNKIATTEWTQTAFGSCVRSVNETVPDSNGNVKIFVRNVGDEWFSYTGKTPPGGVPYLGQLVNRDTFPALWEYVQNNNLVKTDSEWQELDTSQNGNVPFYSDGDGSTTFRMPKIVGYIKGSNDVDRVGTYVREGLPDPSLDFLYRKDSSSSGVFQNIYGNDGWTAVSPSDTSSTDEYMQSSVAFGKTTPFAIVSGNDIYGNSDHVTPETITVLFGVYAYGEINIQGSTITVDQLASEITGIENRFNGRIDSIPHIIKTWTSGDGKSWYRKYSDGWIEQGGIVTGLSISTDDTSITITYPIPFTSDKVFVSANYTTTNLSGYLLAHLGPSLPTKTSFTFSMNYLSNSTLNNIIWKAVGF